MQLRSTLSRFVEDLTPFLDEVIGGGFTPWPMIAGQFLNSKTMDTGWTDIGTRSTLGAFSVKGEVDEQAEDSYIIGPQMRVAAVEYAKRVPTSRIAIEDARTFEEASDLLMGIGKDIREAADNTKEILGHDLLNDASSYTTPDGVVLFSASHLNLQGDTFTNLASGALSETVVENMLLALKDMDNDRGFPIFQQGAKLIVPNALEIEAEKILQTERNLGTNNNDINVVAKRGLSLVVSPWLTSSTACFLQANNHKLNWYDRETGRTWNDVDDNRGIIEQGMTFRCAVAAADPRSIIKTPGT